MDEDEATAELLCAMQTVLLCALGKVDFPSLLRTTWFISAFIPGHDRYCTLILTSNPSSRLLQSSLHDISFTSPCLPAPSEALRDSSYGAPNDFMSSHKWNGRRRREVE